MNALALRRTALYLPGSNQRAIEKARTLATDVVIIDLEDAVAPDAKDAARANAVAAAAAGGFGDRHLCVRVNGLETPFAAADLAAVAASAADVLVVPKVSSAPDAAFAVARSGGKPVWALIETPKAVQAVDAIAATPGIEGLIAGFADLAKDLRARPAADRAPLWYAAARMVNAARAADILAFDGVFTDIRSPEGLEAEARQAVQFGFDGKTCIHPDQLDIVNRIFSPSPADVADAEGLIEAHRAAVARGKGVATYKGRMVEALHVAEAERILAIARRVVDWGGVR